MTDFSKLKHVTAGIINLGVSSDKTPGKQMNNGYQFYGFA